MIPFLPRLRWHTAELMTLAWPVMLSRAGILLMAVADIVMLGHYEVGAAGTLNLGLAVFVPAIVVSIGLCSGMVPTVSRAYGAGAWRECGLTWRRGMIWGLALSVPAAAAVCVAEDILLLFGQTPELAAGGGATAIALAPGIPAQVLFAVSAFYLESTQRPHAAMAAMLLANLINLALNWMLIFGNLGLPELGAVGAALASSIARFAALGVILWAILGQPKPVKAGVRGARGVLAGFWGPGGWQAGREMRRLGMSAGISNGFETFGFTVLTMYAGWLGALALDAYSIAHNILTVVFMFAVGLSVATGVRVGTEIGRGRPNEAVFAGWTGLGFGLGLMVCFGGLVWIASTEIAAFYSSDPEVVARTAALCLFLALVFAPDCGQIVLGQAVRAMGDAWIPIICYVVSFTVFMIPAGWLMVNRAGWDERGLFLIIAVSCGMATILLGLRFRALAKIHVCAPPMQRAHEQSI